MGIKRWWKKDKGGWESVLFMLMAGLVFYASQRKDRSLCCV
jgi:hypothetical protein